MFTLLNCSSTIWQKLASSWTDEAIGDFLAAGKMGETRALFLSQRTEFNRFGRQLWWNAKHGRLPVWKGHWWRSKYNLASGQSRSSVFRTQTTGGPIGAHQILGHIAIQMARWRGKNYWVSIVTRLECFDFSNSLGGSVLSRNDYCVLRIDLMLARNNTDWVWVSCKSLACFGFCWQCYQTIHFNIRKMWQQPPALWKMVVEFLVKKLSFQTQDYDLYMKVSNNRKN